MRAATVVAGGGLTVGELPDPTPGPGQLLVRVRACGICGSDLKTAGLLPDGPVLGHEMAGEVVAAAPDVAADWPVGSGVVSMPVRGCQSCADCAADDPARCSTAALLGVGGDAGAFAELVAVSAAESVPWSGTFELGALVEPVAVGLHLAEAAGLRAGQRVLVVGAGPVGLAVAMWAAHRGAAEVVVSDPSPDRRRDLAHFGATRAVDPAVDDLGTAYDVVVECVGLPGMVDLAINALRPRGRAVIAGVCMEADPFWPVVAVTKDVTLAFASYYTRAEFAEAARVLATGELDASALVTRTVSLDELPEAFARLRTDKDERKVLVLP
ncbi:alcohol dehydrogenase catalytic domain-containing protein [Nocardioides mangrovi]|uniref:Alcohol dehydrogenase catalytic domain-containing protein n=1 Tax=Nocardioides mangrovi TaxID=2874580 RepID=A0ABS7UDQ2_9ACTN|nr:alcohol dehydrogenase catalytic domain-containing protein [Nocardioides mangrovi]MBZ5738793.1 alcohol dehydrogenase catalytic domain-containing protein [Nocardioides mangrovi]